MEAVAARQSRRAAVQIIETDGALSLRRGRRRGAALVHRLRAAR